MPDRSLLQRARDGVSGALLGDALGVPFEFKSAEIIPLPQAIQLSMPAGYNRSHAGVPYGTWSDDGSQLLCLLDSLSRRQGRFDPQDFGEQLLAWLGMGWHQAGGVVFDCGATTRAALARLRAGTNPLDAGETHDRSLGNGSLMRVLPAALAPALWGVRPADAITLAMQQSRLTHGHVLCQVACAAYVQLAMMLLEAPTLLVRDAVRTALDLVGQHPACAENGLRSALARIRAFEREMPTGSGYVANTFWSAILSLDAGKDYLSAVRNAIALGNDTDTTAIVTGGLAGIKYGLASVPEAWPQLSVPAESSALLQSVFPG